MRRLTAIVALCASVAACAAPNMPTEPGTALDRATQNALEGRWVTSETRSPSVCSAPEQDSYEIEFRRTGGAVWVTDTVDNDARVKITAASKADKKILLTLEGDNSSMTITLVGPGEMRVNAKFNNPGYDGVEWAYRCQAPRPEIVEALSPDKAVWFTRRTQSDPFFVEAPANTSGQDLCSGNPYQKKDTTVLEFELIGPVRYDIYEWKDGQYRRDWVIAGSRVGPDGTIAFSTEPKSATSSFTVRQTGNEIYVRELDMKLVRCSG